LNARDALTDVDGFLTAAHHDDRGQLSSLIESALATATQPWRRSPRWINVRRLSTRTPLGVIAAPPPSSKHAHRDDVGDRSALLFLIEPRLGGHRSAVPLLKEVYALTASEATVAAAIADGIAPGQIARATRRSPETVRKHLKRVLQKTQTTSQSELASLIAALPRTL
jgi:DNA-binding CsgD family transcriptional regulator